MTKTEAFDAIYQIRQDSEIKDALALTIKLFFYVTTQVGTEYQRHKVGKNNGLFAI